MFLMISRFLQKTKNVEEEEIGLQRGRLQEVGYCKWIVKHIDAKCQWRPEVVAREAIGEHFEKYLSYAMPMILGAFEVCANIDYGDDEMMEYGNQLRHYTGILQGLKNSKTELMLPHTSHLLCFLEIDYNDKQRDKSVTKDVVVVMGDLADTLGPNAKVLFKDRAFYGEFLIVSSLDITNYQTCFGFFMRNHFCQRDQRNIFFAETVSFPLVVSKRS